MNSANEKWATQAMHWEYSAAAAPDISDIPIKVFPASLHESGATRVIPLDISQHLETAYPATSPGLLANYVRICKNESINTLANSSSEIFYVMYGAGHTQTEFGNITWQQGDVFTLPVNQGVTHVAEEESAFSWVHDEPLFSYTGAVPTSPCFKPAFYGRDFLHAESERVRLAGIEEKRNRNGIILGNIACPKTKTITPSMWSLYNCIPGKTIQGAHRHQSVAIDLALQAGENVYTLIGQKIDEHGCIVEPVKAVWKKNTIFITPPGWWHSHHNESNEDAYVFPFQDAGLHTYLRTLDIQFSV